MKGRHIVYIIGITGLVFGTIFLYVMQFQTLSSIVDRKLLYVQVAVVFILLFIALVLSLVKGKWDLKALDKAKLGLSGIFLCLVISPLVLVMVNKIYVNCDTVAAVAADVRLSASQRFGVLEEEHIEADFIDVYFIDENNKMLKIREYAPFPRVEIGNRFYYKRCRGFTGLQWMKLMEQ